MRYRRRRAERGSGATLVSCHRYTWVRSAEPSEGIRGSVHLRFSTGYELVPPYTVESNPLPVSGSWNGMDGWFWSAVILLADIVGCAGPTCWCGDPKRRMAGDGEIEKLV